MAKMKNVTILAYHKVNDTGVSTLDVSLKNFKQQMEFLRTHKYNVISLEELIKKRDEVRKGNRKIAVITFDDGHKDNYTFAYPILRKYGFPATIFLTTSFIEKEQFLSWEEVKEMRIGGVSFGSHTVTHPYLTKISIEDVKEEIQKSKEIIENELKPPYLFFCYPSGDVNEGIKKIVQECGYHAAVITPPRRGIKEEMFYLKRVGIYRHTTMLQFKLKLWGVYSWIKGR